MENLRQDFILDNREGDYVTIMLQTGTEWTGMVLDWNERRVRIEIAGVPRSVSFNFIVAYYPVVPISAAKKVRERIAQRYQLSEPPAASAQSVPEVHDGPSVSVSPAKTPDDKAEEKKLTAAERAVKRVEEAEYRLVFDADLVSEQLRLAPNTIEKERASALFHSFQRVIASNPGAKSDNLEIKRVLAAAGKLSEQYPESPLTQSVIGEIALCLENWDQAEECFYISGQYARAFYAASRLENEDKLAEDGACHLLYEKKKVPEVICSFLRHAAAAGDLSVFRRFLETESGKYDALFADCLCWLLRHAEQPLPGGEGIAEPTVIDAMKELFDRFYPDPAESQMSALERGDDEEDAGNKNQAEKFLEKPAEETGLTGYLYDYSTFRKIGRVHGETRPDWFFHLNHITDPDLREMLELSPGRRYLVVFDVGHNSNGPCAVNIRLQDHEHPYEEIPASDVRMEGHISRFFPAYMNGQIVSKGESYNFRVDEISDPLLRDYCTVFTDPADREMKVTFSLRLLRDGKLVAVNIHSADGFSDDEQAQIAEAVEQEKHHHGAIFRYYPSQRRGQIEDNGVDYLFDLEQVTDSELFKTLSSADEILSDHIAVRFAAVRRAGRPCAENICREGSPVRDISDPPEMETAGQETSVLSEQVPAEPEKNADAAEQKPEESAVPEEKAADVSEPPKEDETDTKADSHNETPDTP